MFEEDKTDFYLIGQIYTLLFGHFPFSYWDDYGLVWSMVHFVEDLPVKWQPKWDKMILEAGRECPTCEFSFSFQPDI